ncbi:hypothetical protein RirG_076980 [Rhizophagus irregularis DAOM 197198w]|uniref:Uncharacterized protein n=1 Tax=Rhizophagus irregularis (strain DAOM 197198w) TaxID=1432141 RepID=A0A015JQ24_RHIIW|nr:hypothetical protein RirG_076980 [Rhizophagus irregularis DAOM 197198w]
MKRYVEYMIILLSVILELRKPWIMENVLVVKLVTVFSKDSQCTCIVKDKEDLRYDEAVTNVVNMLRNTVAVCITYNEHSAYYDFDEFVDDVERGLVMHYVQGNTTDSGRAIEWIPLRRLEVSESAELFSEVIRSLNLEHRLFIIKKCLADCNGHPRTLENFYQVFNSNEEAKKIHNYSSLIAILTNHIGEWYKHISFPVVKMALLEKSVRLSDIINTNGEQLSISALISSRTYINLLTEKSEAQFVIPTLLPISLQYFCLNNKDDGDAQTATIILQKLLTMESSFDDEVMDGKPFERFHAN